MCDFKEIIIGARKYLVYEDGTIKRPSGKYYRTSKTGKIIESELKEKIVSCGKPNKKGYKRANIGGKVQFVHTIVCAAFYGHIPKNMQVNHIDGNKLNNSIKNLEYVTNQQNRDHAVKMGLIANRKNGYCKITENQIIEIKELYKSGKKQKEIASIYGVCQQTVSIVLKK